MHSRLKEGKGYKHPYIIQITKFYVNMKTIYKIRQPQLKAFCEMKIKQISLKNKKRLTKLHLASTASHLYTSNRVRTTG